MNDLFLNDLFLKVDGVSNREQALTSSINAALQRNKVYKNDENYERREQFKAEWARLLSDEANAYKGTEPPVSDERHCAAIARIARDGKSPNRGGRILCRKAQREREHQKQLRRRMAVRHNENFRTGGRDPIGSRIRPTLVL